MLQETIMPNYEKIVKLCESEYSHNAKFCHRFGKYTTHKSLLIKNNRDCFAVSGKSTIFAA